jgi:hypothetical protein
LSTSDNRLPDSQVDTFVGQLAAEERNEFIGLPPGDEVFDIQLLYLGFVPLLLESRRVCPDEI